MIQEITAHLAEEDLEITFRMDTGYFGEDILETIEASAISIHRDRLFEGKWEKNQ